MGRTFRTGPQRIQRLPNVRFTRDDKQEWRGLPGGLSLLEKALRRSRGSLELLEHHWPLAHVSTGFPATFTAANSGSLQHGERFELLAFRNSRVSIRSHLEQFRRN